ncbi:MAG: hypothetical protein HQ472_10875 [Ignavibacteria bacterium]|nr:hypothetical protein [Ignavibacteria bacterium]
MSGITKAALINRLINASYSIVNCYAPHVTPHYKAIVGVMAVPIHSRV